MKMYQSQQELLSVMWKKSLLFYEQSPITLQKQKWTGWNQKVSYFHQS